MTATERKHLADGSAESTSGQTVWDPETAPLVSCRNCTYAYGNSIAVEDVSFEVRAGEFTVILGPNGSGKSTLLRLVLGLIRPDSGSVNLFNGPANEFRDWKRVAYVPQVVDELSSNFPATVEELVSQGDYKGFSPTAIFRRQASDAVLSAISTTGVGHLQNRRISDLSVGQQQRVLIARALVRGPELLVLDEPVAGVDAGGQEEFYSLLQRLVGDGMAVLLVSHDIGVALREATTVACINRSLVFHGPPHALTGKELHELYGLPIDILLHDDLHEHGHEHR